MRLTYAIPLALFLFFAGVAGYMLTQPKDQSVPSQMMDQPLPDFALEPALDGMPGATRGDFVGGEPRLLNIWASWCGPCRIEHPNIEALAQEGVTIHGINYKDDDANAEAFLKELGDPYTLIGADRKGRGGIEWGVYGVPETFVVNGEGTIVYKHVGPIVQRDMAKMREMIAKAAE